LLSPGYSWANNDDKEEAAAKETKEEDAAKQARLKKEQDTIMAELLALEEGYSDLKGREGEDADSEEARLLKRLTELQTRLDVIDNELKLLATKRQK